MTDIFFTADTHFKHKRICGYSNRPFATLEEHDEALIENWNKVVPKGGRVYHLGDFAMTWKKEEVGEINRILGRLNGQVHLICGNHDREAVKSANFVWQGDYKSITLAEQKIILFHYCIRSWHHLGRGSWHLFGHSHGNLDVKGCGKCMDVGVDCHAYRPISFDEIKSEMDAKEIVS
jgi:calcineurin-like phosphoesterase family protein